jgi:hypothetical protein
MAGPPWLDKRRIQRPATANAHEAVLALNEHRQDQQDQSRRQQPERNVVHPREGHVRRTDHDRNEPVAEAPDHGRHDHEEDHQQAVCGDEHIEHVLAGIQRQTFVNAVHHLGKTMEILDSRLLQFHAHEDGQNATDKAGENGEPKVHRADVLVVGGEQVALDPRRVIIMRVVRCCCVSHQGFPRYFAIKSVVVVRLGRCVERQLALALKRGGQLLLCFVDIVLGLFGPGIEQLFGHHPDGDRHERMVLAAQFRTLAVEHAFLGRP